MNWDAVGAVGQILGSVAVFVTLVYLAIQTRQAKKQMQYSISQHRSQMLTELLLNRASNPRLRGIHSKVRQKQNLPVFPAVERVMEQVGLTEDEAWEFLMEQNAWWNYVSQAVLHRDALLGAELESLELEVRGAYGGPTESRFWYEAAKPFMNPEITRYVDGVIARTQ